MNASRVLTVLLLSTLIAACDVGPGDAGAAPVDSLALRPGYVIDSILPMDEMLRRFRADLGPMPTALEGAAPTRDSLVRRFVRALTDQDTAALARMHLSRAEFAWIYFPSSEFASPPYELPPEILWLQMTAESNKGISRALRAFERGAAYLGHECATTPELRGQSRLWTGCIVRWRDAAGANEEFRLFGSILEHADGFKFVSYGNRL
jgi:hypothetical protein